MNSRIIALYDEAQYKAGSKKTWSTTNLDVAEELVHLVVQECVNICDAYAMPDGTSPTAQILSTAIKKHFGTES
jgi:hypothetical protein